MEDLQPIEIAISVAPLQPNPGGTTSVETSIFWSSVVLNIVVSGYTSFAPKSIYKHMEYVIVCTYVYRCMSVMYDFNT